eukprot:1080173-Prymnesium_polylepis.1
MHRAQQRTLRRPNEDVAARRACRVREGRSQHMCWGPMWQPLAQDGNPWPNVARALIPCLIWSAQPSLIWALTGVALIAALSPGHAQQRARRRAAAPLAWCRARVPRRVRGAADE